MKLNIFFWVAVVSTYKEVKELQEAHGSWESLEEALLENYDYEKRKGRIQNKFNLWVTLIKNHQSIVHVFLEFKRHLVQLLMWDQRWVNKVLTFAKSIDRRKGWPSEFNLRT